MSRDKIVTSKVKIITVCELLIRKPHNTLLYRKSIFKMILVYYTDVAE